jgi:hypothetical protein
MTHSRLSRFSSRSMTGLAIAILATLTLAACNPTSKTNSETMSAVPSVAPPSREVFVIFDGPWAFAPDPKDANGVIAIAPKTKGHRDLFVQSHDKTLATGVYDLSLPPRNGTAAGAVDPNILQTKIDTQSVQHVLDAKSERYAIRLPKPEGYVAAAHSRSRAGSAYPPDASTEKDYVTSVSLRYSVTTLSGFSLAGAPDSGSFNPLLLQVETPTVTFVIDPAQVDDLADLCSTHSRESFHDLTKLLNVTLFVDFPNDPDKCHSSDPQNVRVKAENDRPLTRRGDLRDVREAKIAPSWIASSLTRHFLGNAATRDSREGVRPTMLAAIYYFFTAHVGNCKAPIIVGN